MMKFERLIISSMLLNNYAYKTLCWMMDIMDVNFLYVSFSVPFSNAWKYFSDINDVTESWNPVAVTRNEFIYGNCKNYYNILYYHVHFDAALTPGKLIIRDWLNIIKLPTCIKLRASTYEDDKIVGDDFQIQMCTTRVTYIHSQRRYHYYFYEFFTPIEINKGPDWDIYFYGPNATEWT